MLLPSAWDRIVADLTKLARAESGAILGFEGLDNRKISLAVKGVQRSALLDVDTLSALDEATLAMGLGAIATLPVTLANRAPWSSALRRCFGEDGKIIVLLVSKEGSRRIVVACFFPHAADNHLAIAAETLMKVLPHFQTAFALQKAMVNERERSTRTERALRSCATSSAIVTADLRVKFANRRFGRFVDASGSFIEFRDEVLEFQDEELQSEVEDLIEQARVNKHDHHLRWAKSKRTGVSWIVSVDFLSFGSDTYRFGNVFSSNEPSFLLTIRELSRNTLLTPDDIKTVFGLTPTEAALVHSLANGDAPSDIAKRRGVSKNTVHNQLASAMGRLGVRRQAQLLSSLAVLSFFTK
ncbi:MULTISPECIES: helix-turn-helix transcriptional regulator [Sinorhizobium]|uniref:helix-turn-helix transcriptional regulator n=1 Tax=Sinorhizobium TaxID=28105 RepID=UPI001F3A7C67|nr:MULTISPECIES: LuxR C-terminal-related transcriptional regulator [Sinorhizobium]